MSGRSRRKKLVRSKRLSNTDSVEAALSNNNNPNNNPEAEEDVQPQLDEQQSEASSVPEDAQIAADEFEVLPPLETVSEAAAVLEAVEDEEEESNSDERQTAVQLEAVKAALDLFNPEAIEIFPEASSEDNKNKTKLLTVAASTWRAAADMGDPSGNPKWLRAAVRAVQLQDQTFNHNGTIPNLKGGISNITTTADVIPPPPALPGGVPQPSPPGITPPPGPWGEKFFLLDKDTNNVVPNSRSSQVLVDMGKVVGVLRTHIPSNSEDVEDNDDDNGVENDDDEEEDTYEDDRGHDEDDSLVLADEPEGCPSCAAAVSEAVEVVQTVSNSRNLLHPSSAKSDMLDDSLCGDPLMYATFVAPVHQYSTDTEPSRQASFNYPSRQPSFKQNSSEADGSQPDILQPQIAQPLLGVPPAGVRASLTPERVYVDEVQDIYAKVPPEWPLPPVPPRHQGFEMQQPLQSSDCVEISQEELERQVSTTPSIIHLCTKSRYAKYIPEAAPTGIWHKVHFLLPYTNSPL
jgi:hypothetical protein